MASEYTIDREDAVSVADVIREKAEIEGKLVWPDGWKTAIQDISGDSLNFEVVGGTTRPANPKENTIFVETDVEITGWAVSPVTPISSEVGEGFVWINNISTSSIGFNGLKKNEIGIYPAITSQYVNGAYVRKKASLYKDGTWTDVWSGELYVSGDQYEHITGGWGFYNEGDYAKGTGQIQSSYLYAHVAAYQALSIRPKNQIDITNFSTLTGIVYGEYASSSFSIYMCLFPVKSDAAGTSGATASVAFTMSSGSTVTKSLDVSNLTGLYYVAFKLWLPSGGNLKYRIQEVRLK